MFIISLAYIITALCLALYALNNWVLVFLYWRTKAQAPAIEQTTYNANLPPVTVQLPIYNEADVVERLISNIVLLKYPTHLLQIQVLDDSTDHTQELARKLVQYYQAQGINISYLHRTQRSGFKAGALKAGLVQASGDIIAIFDADFVPAADYLLKTVPYFHKNPMLGFLQTRWGHLNPNYSLLTGAQALALDGHFGVEQAARNRSQLLMNFNGTAGVWRKSCIAAVGGWHGDTICEDLDLSYRAQLAGWQSLYLRHVVAPAEVPPQLAAYKRQQFRWAKGSIQCLKKLGGDVLGSQQSVWVKYQAMLYLSGYLIHPLMILVLLLSLPLILGHVHVNFPLAYLTILSLAPPTLFMAGAISLYKKQAPQSLKYLPQLILLGSGIALSNTKAIIEALLGVKNTFRRTPKYNVAHKSENWQRSAYKLLTDKLVLGEIALSIYALITLWAAWDTGQYLAMPFISLYVFSFGYVSLLGLWEMRYALKLWFKWQPTSDKAIQTMAKPRSILD